MINLEGLQSCGGHCVCLEASTLSGQQIGDGGCLPMNHSYHGSKQRPKFPKAKFNLTNVKYKRTLGYKPRPIMFNKDRTIRHGLMLVWFKDLMNVNEKLQFIDPTF